MTEDEAIAALCANVRGQVEEASHDDSGRWVTCSGCYEGVDGQNVHGFPYSQTFGCVLGGGCSECGGIGARWDTTDYADMAEWMLADDKARAARVKKLRELIQLVAEDRDAHRAALRGAERVVDWCISEHDAPDIAWELEVRKAARRVLRWANPIPALKSFLRDYDGTSS